MPTFHIVAIIQIVANIVGNVAIKPNSTLRYMKIKTIAANNIDNNVELI